MVNINHFREEYIKNKSQALSKVVELVKICKEKNSEYNMFETIMEEPEMFNEKGELSGVPYTLKDNFSTKGITTTASSNILNNYKPIYSSTVYKKLKNSGAILMGKTAMDELGMGGTGTAGHLGIVKNAFNNELIAGGSSSGSAVSVALGIVPFSIGSDTGDSIRKPAAYNNIIGYKPTYGLISRHGLFPFATSLDHVGVLTNNVKDAATVVNIIKGKDERDMTSINSEDIDLEDALKDKYETKKLFYIEELLNIDNYEKKSKYLVKWIAKFHKEIENLKEKGYTIEPIHIPLDVLKAIHPTYTVISCAEATSNFSNLTGITFGPRGGGNNYKEIMKRTRGKGFGSLIKRRFVIGSYALNRENQAKYFLNAKKARGMIVSIIDSYLSEFDGMIMPVGNGHISGVYEDYKITDKLEDALDSNLIIGNFGGYPSITLPCSIENDIPFCINLTMKRKEDERLINFASELESIFKAGDNNV